MRRLRAHAQCRAIRPLLVLGTLAIATLELGGCGDPAPKAGPKAPPEGGSAAPSAADVARFHDARERDTREQRRPRYHLRTKRVESPDSISSVEIAPGEEGDSTIPPDQNPADTAIGYYADITSRLGLALTPNVSPLSELLVFVGYKALEPQDVEELASDVLMDFAKLSAGVRNPQVFASTYSSAPIAAGEIVSTRYFAPKITDVSGETSLVKQYGWRKIVKFRSRTGSPAKTKGIDALWLLFNFFSPAASDPFASDALATSVNNQAMLVRDSLISGGATVDAKDSAFWLVYGPRGAANATVRYPLITYLDATFDAAAPNIAARRYYVPVACAACHSVSPSGAPKLNFLDSDHILDRVGVDPTKREDDFDELGDKWPVLYDAGRDRQDPKYAVGFQAVRDLNTAVKAHADVVDPSGSDIGTRHVRKWLDLHQTTTSHIRPIARGIEGANATRRWDPANANDAALLPLLNRFCYRCHSSLYYSVFDKEAVRGLAGLIQRRLRRGLNPTDVTGTEEVGWMPQDRLLDPLIIQLLLDKVTTLANEP